MTDADDIRGRDRIRVEIDGEELDVYNHVSVSTKHYVNSVNSYETFEPDVAKGDMGVGPQPEAITDRVAELLYAEWGIEASSLGIRVVDVSDPEVEIL